MFRVSFLVEDKKLATALRALDGLAYGLEQHPVKAEKKEKGDGAQRAEAALAHLPGTFTRRQFCEATGLSVSGAGAHLNRLRAAKLIRSRGTGAGWQKVKAKGADK